MEKSLKWQSPSSDSDQSESPTLSDKPQSKPVAVKRKRSNIFTKLRKSILGIGSNEDSTSYSEDDEEKRKSGIKRALSMDAGLQNRISELIATEDGVKDENNPIEIIQRTLKNGIRRSKSLITSPILNKTDHQSTGSAASSPRHGATANNDSIFEDLFLDRQSTTASLINTIETKHLLKSHQVFNCSWLAPTKKSQIFTGHLTLLPGAESIQFTCQHLTRSIRLKFFFDDILNISRGSWNEKRNQALIIDLIRGRRKTWVFVAWNESEYEQAIDVLVRAWRTHCMNLIKSRLDRRKAHFNMKYCRIIREADRVNEARLLLGPIETIKRIFISWFKQDENEDDCNNTISFKSHGSYTLKHILFERRLANIVPQPLASILTEQSTNFMTNFRVLHGIDVTNDSGWKENNRTFVSSVRKGAGGSSSHFKWKVRQQFVANTTDSIVTEATLMNVDNPQQVFKFIYEFRTEFTNTCVNSDPITLVKISAEMEETSLQIISLKSEEEICAYFREIYFPTLFNLLEALIEESRSSFDNQQEPTLNPTTTKTFRFVKDSLLIKLLEVDLYFTILFLPFIYKLVHFKEFKWMRLTIIGVVLVALVRITLTYIKLYDVIDCDVEGQFETFIKDLSNDTVESETIIHKLKLKYI